MNKTEVREKQNRVTAVARRMIKSIEDSAKMARELAKTEYADQAFADLCKAAADVYRVQSKIYKHIIMHQVMPEGLKNELTKAKAR